MTQPQPVVVDASVAVKWVLDEEFREHWVRSVRTCPLP